MWGKSAGTLWGAVLTAKARGVGGEGVCVFSAMAPGGRGGEGEVSTREPACQRSEDKASRRKGHRSQAESPPLNVLLYKTVNVFTVF